MLTAWGQAGADQHEGAVVGQVLQVIVQRVNAASAACGELYEKAHRPARHLRRQLSGWYEPGDGPLCEVASLTAAMRSSPLRQPERISGGSTSVRFVSGLHRV